MLTMTTEDFHRFVAGISFVHLQPYQHVLEELGGHDAVFTLPPQTRNLIETWNAMLGVPRNVSLGLQSLSRIPRMSTLAVGALIQYVVSALPADEMYVNVGLWNGYSLFAGMIENPEKQCIGIDNFSQFGDPKIAFLKEFAERKSPAHRFFEQDYREYFKAHTGNIGFYFYDGNHEYAHQKEGLERADPFIVSGGIVLVDDTNWEEPRKATQDFLLSTDGAYECIFDQSTAHNFHPTWWNGLMVLRKK